MFIQSIRQTHSHTKEIRVYSQIEQKVEIQDKLLLLRALDERHPQSTFPLLLAVLEGWAAAGQLLSVCPGGLCHPSPMDMACQGGIHLHGQSHFSISGNVFAHVAVPFQCVLVLCYCTQHSLCSLKPSDKSEHWTQIQNLGPRLGVKHPSGEQFSQILGVSIRRMGICCPCLGFAEPFFHLC